MEKQFKTLQDLLDAGYTSETEGNLKHGDIIYNDSDSNMPMCVDFAESIQDYIIAGCKVLRKQIKQDYSHLPPLQEGFEIVEDSSLDVELGWLYIYKTGYYDDDIKKHKDNWHSISYNGKQLSRFTYARPIQPKEQQSKLIDLKVGSKYLTRYSEICTYIGIFDNKHVFLSGNKTFDFDIKANFSVIIISKYTEPEQPQLKQGITIEDINLEFECDEDGDVYVINIEGSNNYIGDIEFDFELKKFQANHYNGLEETFDTYIEAINWLKLQYKLKMLNYLKGK